jgi:putative Holliday junction resolvase
MTPQPSVLLAIDFGLKRIGIATGNRLTGTATPLTTLESGRELPWPALDRLIADWQPDRLVLGCPGSPGAADLREQILSFAAALRERYGLDVELVDEALTSSAAASALREERRAGRLGRRIAKGRIDRLAACLIAEQWMQETDHGR